MISYEQNGDIKITGWEQGIADSPYDGISDIRNINLISIPKEASVNFSTKAISYGKYNGTMTTSSSANDTVTFNSTSVGDPGNGVAITFSVLSDATKGIALNTLYWLTLSGGVFQLWTDMQMSGGLVDITADSLTGTWATVNMGIPRYFTYATGEGTYWMIDSLGQVWTNAETTAQFPFYWIFSGNKVNSFSQGNGLVYYRASDGTGYIFAFSSSSIDYTPSLLGSIAWQYQWQPGTDATPDGWSNTPTPILKTPNSVTAGTSDQFVSHEAMVATDNRVYFCDANQIDSWYQTSPSTPFVPATLNTFTYTTFPLLPYIDTAQCLTQLGTNLLIGAKSNVIYPWDRLSNFFSYPILLPEYNTVKMVTVNTNTFILVGNRGRVYITNGSQVQLYKKIPDHLARTSATAPTIEPYFTWGGLCSTKNQIYFSALATTNAGGALSTYGGVWAIDVDTKAIRLTNKLSYGTYAGYATALIPNFTNNPNGTGLIIGWNSGASTYGLDITQSAPYSTGEAYLDSDLIPIGTFLKPTTNGRVEFKLAVPLVASESIQLYYRQKFSDDFTAINAGEVGNGLWNTAGDYSGVCRGLNFQQSQWIQIRAVLTSVNGGSFVRLTELRIGQ